MMATRWNKLSLKALDFANVHLFITLISMPILIAWGLPISLLSPLGNLIFNPVLTVFLLLSSLIFFTEMLYIPNGIFIWLLEQVTKIWNYSLNFQCTGALCGFKTPPMWLLIIIPCITFALVVRVRTARERAIGLSTLFILSWLLLNLSAPSKTFSVLLPCNTGHVSLVHHNGKTVLIDPGVIGQRISAPSWIAYTLIPEITKLTGSLIIDYVIITKPGLITFEALKTLCKKITVKNVYLPYMDGEMDNYMKKKFYWLYAFMKRNNINVFRINNKPISIAIDTAQITIVPTKKKSYRSIAYYHSDVLAYIDNPSVPLYDSKKSTS